MTRNVREAHVSEIMGFYGRVESVRLAIDERVGLPRGSATVEFASPDEADEACTRLSGGQIDGNVVTIRLMHRPPPKDADRGVGAGGPRPDDRRARSRSRERGVDRSRDFDHPRDSGDRREFDRTRGDERDRDYRNDRGHAAPYPPGPGWGGRAGGGAGAVREQRPPSAREAKLPRACFDCGSLEHLSKACPKRNGVILGGGGKASAAAVGDAATAGEGAGAAAPKDGAAPVEADRAGADGAAGAIDVGAPDEKSR